RMLRLNLVASDEDRKAIKRDPELMNLGKLLISKIHSLLEEFVFEGELYTIPEYELRLAEEFFEKYIFSMGLFTEEGDAVHWLEVKDDIETLVIMPRLVTDILD